jgi:hypothetical protein
MDEQRRMFSVMMAEIFRIQKELKVPHCPSDATIYGLRNGIQEEFDRLVPQTGVETTTLTKVSKILGKYVSNPETLKGFYEIESELSDAGVDRSDSIRIFTYLQARREFVDVLSRLDSQDSPSECRTFDLMDGDV